MRPARIGHRARNSCHRFSIVSPAGFLRHDHLLLFGIFCAQFIFFLFLASQRIVDSDEGFYLYASKLITAGTVIYRDVFYPQMPLLPYVYGSWMNLFGIDWQMARVLSALLTALIGGMLFQHIRSSTERITPALSAILLYAFNISVLLFFLTAKTYALSVALLFSSLLMERQSNGKSPLWGVFASGLLLGLSVQARLFFIIIAPVAVFDLWRRQKEKRSVLPGFFCLGFAAGSAPSAIFLLVAPGQFVFDNLTYHSIRNPFGLIAQLDQKLEVLGQLLAGSETWRPTQFSLLAAGSAAGLLLWRRLNHTTRLSIFFSLALGAVSLLPTPAFGQYFCVLVPFLIISFIGSAHSMAGLFISQSRRKAFEAALLVLSLAYAGWTITRIESLFVRSEMAPGLDIYTTALDWKISTIEKVAHMVEENTRPDDLVVSVWPGYLLTADRRLYPRMENQFTFDSSMRISPEEASRYRMMREDEIAGAVRDPATGTVIIGNWSHERIGSFGQLPNEMFKCVGYVGNTKVFARIRPGSPVEPR
ncbi:hypothetical protein HZA56_05925 [Candidatus Poribacteria bacterium]|nr:hypothetical protein [Candidatus Poribacteria bacterium]